MKTEEIKQLFKDFESAASEIEGVECWSGRDMQLLLGYSKWENFEKVIQKAKTLVTMQVKKLPITFLTSGR
jgi:DNA-damage-inducible protein D